jgi:hypothetical protein
MALDLDQLKRIGSERKDDHVHEMPDGSLTSGAIPAMDNTHAHTYGQGERTVTAEDTADHTHATDQGQTSGPV